jgi:hypothetical protein
VNGSGGRAGCCAEDGERRARLGRGGDWLKNVLASGGATLVHNGRSYQCDEPEVIPTSEAEGGFSAAERRILRLMGVDEYLRVRRVESAEGV